MHSSSCNSFLAGMKHTNYPQESLKDISQKLKRFRPAATVLEAEVAPARRGEGAGVMSGPGMTASANPSDFQEVMKAKRKHHGDAIKVKHI